MDSTESGNMPSRVILELLSSHGQMMSKEELQKIRLKTINLLAEKEGAALTKSAYAFQGDQLHCPKEMVLPRVTKKDGRVPHTLNAKQVNGTALCSSASSLPAWKAPPTQRKAKDPVKPVAQGKEEEKYFFDSNKLICFPDGFAPRWWTGTGLAYFNNSMWHYRGGPEERPQKLNQNTDPFLEAKKAFEMLSEKNQNTHPAQAKASAFDLALLPTALAFGGMARLFAKSQTWAKVSTTVSPWLKIEHFETKARTLDRRTCDQNVNLRERQLNPSTKNLHHGRDWSPNQSQTLTQIKGLLKASWDHATEWFHGTLPLRLPL